MCSVSGCTRIWATMSFFEFCDTVMCRGSRRATSICMPRKPYQRRSVSLRSGEVEVAVDGDRVVQGVDEGPAVAHEPEETATETLVVVDEVELGAALAQVR